MSTNTSHSTSLPQNNGRSNTSAGQTDTSTSSDSRIRINVYLDYDWWSSPSVGDSGESRPDGHRITFKVEAHFFSVPEYRFMSGAPGFLRHPELMKYKRKLSMGHRTLRYQVFRFRASLETFLPSVRVDILTPAFLLLTDVCVRNRADTKLSNQDWTSILKSSTMFKAKRLRKKAILHLEHQDLPWIDKLVLGQTCFVENWFRDGCVEMISLAPGTISAEDMNRIGLRMVIRAFQAMERSIKLPVPSNLPPRRTDSERLANKISADEFQDILPTLSQEPTNLVEEFWRSKVEGRADLLKEAASKVIKRLSSITWAEVEEHQHQLEDIERLLNGRLRYKDKRQYKLDNGRSKALKLVDYQSAFEREFGPDLEDIRSRGQALEPRRPRFDDDPSSEERQTEVKNGLLDFAIAKYRIAIPFKFQVPAYIIAGVLFLLCIAWLAYYYLLPLDRSNFPSVSPIVASALDL